MTASRVFRLPPAGRRFGPGEIAAMLSDATATAQLQESLRRRLDASAVQLFASGRAALRVALASAAKRSDRHEVILPAYTCYSVAAAAVAAGLRIRLVDVTPSGALDARGLSDATLGRAAAVVVCNLFGFAEPMAALAPRVRANGAALVDDAAQALGARGSDGWAGARGDVAILSFGRGKPLSALGGGALVFCHGVPDEEPPAPAPGRRLRTLFHALAYDLALSPRVFGWLAAVPALGIGETPFDPGFGRGGISRDAAAMAFAVLRRLDEDRRGREAEAVRLAACLSSRTALLPISAAAGATGAYPRLACLAPDARLRDAAVEALARVGAGVSTMYPASLGDLPDLAPHLEGELAMPGARQLAARVLTLPTHGGLRGARLDAALRALSLAGCT